jgi:hypothetical protein
MMMTAQLERLIRVKALTVSPISQLRRLTLLSMIRIAEMKMLLQSTWALSLSNTRM